ncbi:MAG: FecR domain-containing protein [Pseudomonadota bacterium]
MTNPTPPGPDDAAWPRSADAWFARLHGTPSAADRAAFERWSEDPDNAHAYAHLVRTWDQSMFLAHTAAGRGRDLTRARRRVSPAWGAVAAGIVLMLLVAGGLATVHGRWWGAGAPGVSAAPEFASGDGIRAVILPDRSRVTIRIAFTGGERRLQLLRGRGRFDVAPDPARPFMVDAGPGRVVAHGTVFDVALEGREVRVVLLRGAVEVRRRSGARPARGDDARYLVPGQAIRFGSGPLPVPTAADLDLHWTSAMIAFDDVPLDAAVAAFNRTSPHPVRLEGRAVSPYHLTGAFRRDDPDGFARTVAATFGLARRDDSGRGILLAEEPPGLRKKTIG